MARLHVSANDKLIDLTKSDSEDDGPLSSIHTLAPTQTKQPKRSPIPLPVPSRRPHQSLRSSSTSLYSDSRPKQTASSSSLRTDAGTSSSASGHGQRKVPSNGYVAPTWSTNNDKLNGNAPDKRRKLSMGGKRRSEGPPPPTFGDIENVRHGVATPGMLNVNSGTKLNTMNGLPSVHYLKSALKTDSNNVAIPEELLIKESRRLQIGRRSGEEGHDLADRIPKPGSRHRVPSPQAPESSFLEQELGSSDLDIEEMDWDDSELGLETLRTRTPNKKRRKSAHLRGEGNEYRLKKPKLPLKGVDSTPDETLVSIDSASLRREGNEYRLKRPSLPIKVANHAHEALVPRRSGSQLVQEEDRDSVISDSPLPTLENSTSFGVPTSNPTTGISTPEPIRAQSNLGKFTNRFEEEEDHLLIYLKEVKGLRWSEIEKEFPLRTYSTLQTHYSHVLNKRDRSLDPIKFNIPAKYAQEEWRSNHRKPGAVARSTETRTIQEQGTRRKRGRPPLNRKLLQHENSYSSASESTTRSTIRPRRSAKAVDYKWPRQRRSFALEAMDSDLDDFVVPDSIEVSPPLRSSTEPFLGPSRPETVIPVDEQMEVDFDQEDASIVTTHQMLNYLSASERLSLRYGSSNRDWDVLSARKWQGTIVHIDFSHKELDIVERVLAKVLPPTGHEQLSSRRKRLRHLLRDQTEARLLKASYELRRRLYSRDRESIDAFLLDAKDGKIRPSDSSCIERMGSVRTDKTFSSAPKASITSIVRQRELGLQSSRGWKSASQLLTYQVKNTVYDTLGPAYSYTGASSDVHTVAWSPNGQCFAAGAVCVTDPDSMQYNRPNNLLYGDVHNKVIHELADHHIDRPRTTSGPNSTHAMYTSQDPRIFTTVSSVAFSPDGEYMISAGYDHYAYIWQNTSNGSAPEYVKGLKHKAEVDLMTINCSKENNLLATASKRGDTNAIKVIARYTDDKPLTESYTSRKADERPDDRILPTALRFEPTYGTYLLGGFGANKRQDRLDMNGDICLWDVETKVQINVHGSTRNVFDVAFNPIARSQPLFAVGCVAGANVNRGTRSLVRLYDGRGASKYTMNMELECPALDMNDVAFCPYDENVLAAGCTDGRVYIWDIRWPDHIKYTLSHGKSLMPLHDFEDPEVSDTGVRFLSWGDNATRMYTGSSDGVVKVWDVVRSTEEVFIKDLITADSGIMSGAFSPDRSRLVVGEVNGSINVLEVGKNDNSARDAEKLRYIPEPFDIDEIKAGQTDADSGVTIASTFVESSEIDIVPFGGFPIRQAVQGPNYNGPYDMSNDAPDLHQRALLFQAGLAEPPGNQCDLQICKDNIVKITSEEIGDSGRSTDRIPDALRLHWKTQGSNKPPTATGKPACKHCGRSAQPLDALSAFDDPILCERCSFACFRCGEYITVPPETEVLYCRACERMWEIGTLGYECIEETRTRALLPDVPTLARYDSELAFAKKRLDDNASFGDEMNALTDYYFSLAIDAVESPPL